MSDYSIKRRRVRHNYCFKPVDPCLGFYAHAHKPERRVSHERGTPDHPNQRSDKPEAERSPLDPSSITVERFLRRNVKKYNRRKARVTQTTSRQENSPKSIATFQGRSPNHLRLRSRVVERIIDEDSSDSSESGGEDDEEPAPPRRTSRTERKHLHMRRPLRDRLFEALVSTYGDPDDCLTRPQDANVAGDAPEARIPLRFVPVQQDPADDVIIPSSESPSGQDQPNAPRSKGWTLVDPRKSTAMRSATFAGAEKDRCKGTMNIMDGWPIRKWKEENTFPQSSIHKRSRRPTRSKPSITAKASTIDDRPARVPLNFVELTPSGDFCQARQGAARVGGFPLSEAGQSGEGTRTHLQLNGRGRQRNAPDDARALDLVPVSRPAWHGTSPSHDVFETSTSHKPLLNRDSPASSPSSTPGRQTSLFPGRFGKENSVHLRSLSPKGQDRSGSRTLTSSFACSSPTGHVGQHKASDIHRNPLIPPRFTKPLRPLGSL